MKVMTTEANSVLPPELARKTALSATLPLLLAVSGGVDAAADHPAVFDPVSKTFTLADSDNVRWTIFGGDPSWIPISGDWKGGGEGGIGLYNPAKRRFFFKDKRADGSWDGFYKFNGITRKFLPVTGDWNADGKDGVGVYNPKSGTFLLKGNGKKSKVSGKVKILDASKSWKPVSGQWGSNGADSVGLYDPATQTFHLKYKPGKGKVDLKFRITVAGAQPTWLPVTGDWDGNGVGGLGLYDPQSGKFYLVNDYTKATDHNPDLIVSAPLVHTGLMPLSVKMSGPPSAGGPRTRVLIGSSPTPAVINQILQPAVNQALYPALDVVLARTVEPVLLAKIQPLLAGTLQDALAPILQALNLGADQLLGPAVHNILGTAISRIIDGALDGIATSAVQQLMGQLSQVVAANPLLANLTPGELTQLLTNLVQQTMAQNPDAVLAALNVDALIGQLLPTQGAVDLAPIVKEVESLKVGAVLNQVPVLGTVTEEIFAGAVGKLNTIFGLNLVPTEQSLRDIMSALDPDQVQRVQAQGALDDIMIALLGPVLNGPLGILTQSGLTGGNGQVAAAASGIVSGLLGNVQVTLATLTADQISSLITPPAR